MSAPDEYDNENRQRRPSATPPSTDQRRIQVAVSSASDVAHAPATLDEASSVSWAEFDPYQISSFSPSDLAAGLLWTQQQQHEGQVASQLHPQNAIPGQPVSLSVVLEQLAEEAHLLQPHQPHASSSLHYSSALYPSAHLQRASTVLPYLNAGQPPFSQDVASLRRQYKILEVTRGSPANDLSSLPARRAFSVAGISVPEEQRGSPTTESQPWRSHPAQAQQSIQNAAVMDLSFCAKSDTFWHNPTTEPSFRSPPAASPVQEHSDSAHVTLGSQFWKGSPAEYWSSGEVSKPTMTFNGAFYAQAAGAAARSTSSAASGGSKSSRRGGRRTRSPTMPALSFSSQVESEPASRSLRRCSTIGTSSLPQLGIPSASLQPPDVTKSCTGHLKAQGTPNTSATPTNLTNESDKRASIACVRCRRRKLRCDQDVPCRQCERRGLGCEYALTQSQMERVDEPTGSLGSVTASGSLKSRGRRKTINGRPTLGDIVQRSAISRSMSAQSAQGPSPSPIQDTTGTFAMGSVAAARVHQPTPYYCGRCWGSS